MNTMIYTQNAINILEEARKKIEHCVSAFFQAEDVKKALFEANIKLDGKTKVKTVDGNVFIVADLKKQIEQNIDVFGKGKSPVLFGRAVRGSRLTAIPNAFFHYNQSKEEYAFYGNHSIFPTDN